MDNKEIITRIKRFNYWTKFCFALSDDAYYDWNVVLGKKEYEIVFDEKLWSWAEETFKKICRQHTIEYLDEARARVGMYA